MAQDKIQNIFKVSIDFAEKLGSLTVETEHLLFGILSEESTVAYKILNSYGITKTKYASVVKSISKGATIGAGIKPSLSKNVSLIFSNIQYMFVIY